MFFNNKIQQSVSSNSLCLLGRLAHAHWNWVWQVGNFIKLIAGCQNGYNKNETFCLRQLKRGAREIGTVSHSCCSQVAAFRSL